MNQAEIEIKVPASHPALPGHFPGQPIVPGVVLLALVHQQARQQIGFAAGGSRWRRIKFLNPVLPEQTCHLKLSGNHDQFSFQIESADGQTMARGQCRHAALA